jgi:hypothetical protein
MAKKTLKKIQNDPTPLLIEDKILVIRGQKVMLDSDLAKIYGIPTKRFNEQVKRNLERFPEDFMFQLTFEELTNLRSQFVTSSGVESNWSQFATSSSKHRGKSYLPYAFTEHGIAMLSSVLNSPRAIQMNIFIIRTFIKLREIFLSDKDFEIRILDLESIQEKQSMEIEEILQHLRLLTDEPKKPAIPFGFQP